MLATVYRMLALALGEPVQNFKWTMNGVEKEYTPLSFYREFLGNDLDNNYVMLMNDPSREYYKCYEIDYDRHVYDGKNWTYVNLPVEDIKQMAIASIKDSTMMYFSAECLMLIITIMLHLWELSSVWIRNSVSRLLPAVLPML